MINYLIVEDERLAYEELKRMIYHLRSHYQLVKRIETVEQTVDFLRNYTVDLIFMDIQLASGNCFDIFEQININIPIIFTTAYNEHAIQAFKVNSIDYLLKPIEEKDLQAALNKFELLGAANQSIGEYKKLENIFMSNSKKNRFLTQTGDTYHYVETSEIAFFYSEDKVVFLHTMADKRHIINYTLDQIEKLLDEKIFFRVSRNAIANINSIKKISKYFNSRLKLFFSPECPHEILVSRVRVPDFLKWLDGIQ